MNLLITGATGFIGSAVVRLALARGHRVATLVRPTSTRPLPPGTERIVGTLAAPDWDALATFRPDCCIHAAWIATPGEYLTSPANRTLLEESTAFLLGLRARGLRHAVVAGTCIEYAASPVPLVEDTSCIAPSTLYAECKNELRLRLERAGFDLAWARIFHPFGPGEDPRRLASFLLQRIFQRQEIMLQTPDSTKDFVFLDDVASALLTLAERRFRGVVNVGTGDGISVRRLAEIAAQSVGVEPRLRTPDSPVHDPFPFLVADNQRLRALGWQPAFTLEQGLARLADSLRT